MKQFTIPKISLTRKINRRICITKMRPDGKWTLIEKNCPEINPLHRCKLLLVLNKHHKSIHLYKGQSHKHIQENTEEFNRDYKLTMKPLKLQQQEKHSSPNNQCKLLVVVNEHHKSIHLYKRQIQRHIRDTERVEP